MKTGLFLVLMILVGLGLGVVSALWMAGLIGEQPISKTGHVEAEGWYRDWSIGSQSANPYLRAHILRYGLLALSKQEAVYFTRAQDDDGEPLRETCVYELSGRGQKALWWSITLYDSDSRLPINTDAALSVDATRIGSQEDWRAIISPKKPGGDTLWLSSQNAGVFDLTLRIYRSDALVLKSPQTYINAPALKRMGCTKPTL